MDGGRAGQDADGAGPADGPAGGRRPGIGVSAVREFGPPAAPAVDATRDLYERHANRIFRYCLRELRSREEAEDAVQATFLNALRGLRAGVVPASELAWLYKIAHNVCLQRVRSRVRRGRVEVPGDVRQLEAVASPGVDRRGEELMRLPDALRAMPERQREAIVLREWHGLSYEEIGERLGLSHSAVETLLFRARRTLARGLEKPVVTTRRRLRQVLDLGWLGGALKALVGGGAVAKSVAGVAVAVMVGGGVAASTSNPRAPVAKETAAAPLQFVDGGALVASPVTVARERRAAVHAPRRAAPEPPTGVRAHAPLIADPVTAVGPDTAAGAATAAVQPAVAAVASVVESVSDSVSKVPTAKPVHDAVAAVVEKPKPAATPPVPPAPAVPAGPEAPPPVSVGPAPPAPPVAAPPVPEVSIPAVPPVPAPPVPPLPPLPVPPPIGG